MVLEQAQSIIEPQSRKERKVKCQETFAPNFAPFAPLRFNILRSPGISIPRLFQRAGPSLPNNTVLLS